MNIHNPNIETPKVTTGALPASRKIHVAPDAAPELRVPLREIVLSEGSGEPPLPVYDTSGPYTDEAVTIDVEKGLSRARIQWVKERGGVEEYAGRPIKPVDNGNATGKYLARAFPNTPRPLRGIGNAPVTQYEFARAGIVTKEMIYVAARENCGRKVNAGARGSGTCRRRKFRRVGARRSSRRNSCATRSRAAARSSPATSITANSSR